MNNKTENIIKQLRDIDVDGETMQYILEEVGMEDQMLKQLVMTSSDLSLNNVLEERESLEQRGFWQEVYNRELELKKVGKKVWDDFSNNDTLTFNTFEEYWKEFKL